MNKLKLRGLMLKNRVFLHLVQTDSVKNTRQRITVCTSIQANLLLHILHYISVGEIPVKKAFSLYLRKTRKMPFLNKIRNATDLSSMLKKSRKYKVDFLKKLTVLYPKLLALLFEED